MQKKKSGDQTTSVVPFEGDFARELTWWEQQLAEKENALAELTLKVQDTRNAMKVFAGEYNTRVGIFYAKISRILLDIRIYQFRLKQVQEKGTVSKDLLSAIETEIDEKFGEERSKFAEEEKAARESSEEYRKHLREQERAELFTQEFKHKLRALFHALALKFHPDKAQSDDERREFNRIMAAINEAYAGGDMEILFVYLQQAERMEKIQCETPEERLGRLKKECTVLDAASEKLSGEFKTLVESELYQLRKKVFEAREAGEDLMAELSRRAKNELNQKQELLDELIGLYKETLTNIGNTIKA